VQMAFFLKTYFSGETIVANDIGAISFFDDIRLVDLWGLASIETARALRSRSFNTEFVRGLTRQRDGKIAIVHKKSFDKWGGLPAEWEVVGEWIIRGNLICWDDTVTFYAVDPSYRERLRSGLQSFRSQLPFGVECMITKPSELMR